MSIDGRGCHKAEASIALAKANEELSGCLLLSVAVSAVWLILKVMMLRESERGGKKVY